MKRGLLYKEKSFSLWGSELVPYRVHTFFSRKQNSLIELSSLKMYHIRLFLTSSFVVCVDHNTLSGIRFCIVVAYNFARRGRAHHGSTSGFHLLWAQLFKTNDVVS